MGASAWYIESMDARAGLAFASWRTTDIAPSLREDRHATVFIGAPDFQSEPIGNEALAFGASRASFQEGFYVEGREVGFPSTDALAEFVRRLYLGSGGGDGNDGPPGDLPPPMPIDGPNLPELAIGDRDHDRDHDRDGGWRSALQRFGRSVTQQEPGQSVALDADFWDAEDPRFLMERLRDGCMLVAQELMARAPPDGNTAQVRWLRITRSLGSRLCDIGIWPLLMPGDVRSIIGALPRASFGGFAESFPSAMASSLFCGVVEPDDEYGLSEVEGSFPYHWRWYSHGIQAGTSLDPLELLGALPLPRSLQHLAAGDQMSQASVYHALCACAASPELVLRNDQPSQGTDADAALGVLLFAAACIVACVPSRASPWGGTGRWPYGGGTPLQRAQAQATAHDAYQWLGAQWPRHAYSRAVEDAIASARTLQYASRQGVAHRNVPPAAAWPFPTAPRP